MTGSSATVELLASTKQQWTWDVLTPIDPARFYPKYGPLPAVQAVRDQTGPWSIIGQSRTLLLSDGSSVVETITDIEQPSYFGYQLTDFTKLFGRLVDHANAEWSFDPQTGGTLVTWTYTFHARKRWGWAVSLIVRLFWEPYMRQVLPEIVHEAERLS